MLEAAAQWRTITPEQEQIITNSFNQLKPFIERSKILDTNQEITIRASGSDNEANWYAAEVSRVLNECGFKTFTAEQMGIFRSPNGLPFSGMEFCVKSIEYTTNNGLLNSTFKGNAGIIYGLFKTAEIPVSGVQQDTDLSTDVSLYIIVGHKPK